MSDRAGQSFHRIRSTCQLDLKVCQDGNDRAFAEFRQVYQSNLYRDTTQKTLEMIKVNGKWLINRESAVPCAGGTAGGCKGGAK